MKKIIIIFTLIFTLGCTNTTQKIEEPQGEEIPEDIRFILENEPEKDYVFAREIQSEKKNNGSLWNNGDRSIFNDRKARQIGDIVTMIIREDASATQSATNSRDKSGSIDGKAGTGFLNLIPEMGAEGSTELSNTGSSSRSNNFTATVSAVIRDIDQYGNLYIVGERSVLINNELQEINISGFVRPNDIGTDNSVNSTSLANARVKYNGKMVFDRSAEPGLVSNFLSSTVGLFF